MGDLNKREEDILTAISDALPEMDEFSKGYLLGMAEERANRRKEAQSTELCEAAG